LLKKIVPTILMCRRFRENQSERGGKGFRVPLLPVIDHHPIGLDVAVGAYDDGAITSAFRGVDTLGDIHLHGKTPGKVVSLLVSPLCYSVKLIEEK
jgi:hypothetical protein